MDINLVGAGIMNSVKPYCRKHVIDSLDASEFVLLNTIIIGAILVGYIWWSKKSIKDICAKYYTLTWTQIASISLLSAITVGGTMLKLTHDKKSNPTFTNGLIVKGITSAIVILVGIMFYNETYTWKTWAGIATISLGLYLLS
jgi:drug/metabolite transporter (DMT)-like permease